MRKVTRWMWCFPAVAAVALYGGFAGVTEANAQEEPPLPPPVEEAPPVDEPPAPAPPEPAPEAPPVPEQPIAPPEPPPALPEVDMPETAAVIEGDEETEEITGDTFDWVLDRVNELLQQQPQIGAPEHEEILDALVDQQVFIADAKEAGVEVAPAEVEAEIDEIRETIPEGFEFEDALAQEGLTEDKFESMMEDQLHAQTYVDALAEQDEYQDLELTPQEEIDELLSVLMFELDATQYRVMAERVDDVRGDFDVEVDEAVDFDDVEAPEPEEPVIPEEPLPVPDLDEEPPAPDVPPAPQPDVPM